MVDLGNSPALIVIDMQNGFCDEGGFMNKLGLDYTASRGVIGPIGELRQAAREAAIPIVFTRYSLDEDYSDAGLLTEKYPAIVGTGGLVRGSWDADVVEPLTPLPGELVVDKTRYSAFFATDLEDRLRKLGIDTVIVCGVTTNVCVEDTVRDAFARDIRVVVPSDGTAAVTPELHEASLRSFEYGLAEVATIAEIREALGSRVPATQTDAARPD